jgi:hypothetical protein
MLTNPITICDKSAVYNTHEDMQSHTIVTYYLNGASLNGIYGLSRVDMYYNGGDVILTDITRVGSIMLEKIGFTLKGWYSAELDENNLPKCDVDGNVILSDGGIAAKRINEDEHLYYGALWEQNPVIDVAVITEDGGDITINGNTIVKSGTIINTREYDSNGVFAADAIDPISMSDENIKTDYTFVFYFNDEACTDPVTTLSVPEDGHHVKIYAKYIKGSWTIIRTAEQVRLMMLYTNVCDNFYIYSPAGSKIIDCSHIAPLPLSIKNFNIHIEGNGYTIKGLRFSHTAVDDENIYSIFGKICSDAVINNLTFKDLQLDASIVGNAQIYMICSNISQGATLNNLQFISPEFVVYSTDSITNIPLNDGVYNLDNYLFGGVSSDKEFLKTYSGVTITDELIAVEEYRIRQLSDDEI